MESQMRAAREKRNQVRVTKVPKRLKTNIQGNYVQRKLEDVPTTKSDLQHAQHEFRNQFALKRHVRERKLKNNPRRVAIARVGSYSDSSQLSHMKSRVIDSNYKKIKMSKPAGEDRKVRCRICSETFLRGFNLRRHENEVHGGVKRLQFSGKRRDSLDFDQNTSAMDFPPNKSFVPLQTCKNASSDIEIQLPAKEELRCSIVNRSASSTVESAIAQQVTAVVLQHFTDEQRRELEQWVAGKLINTRKAKEICPGPAEDVDKGIQTEIVWADLNSSRNDKVASLEREVIHLKEELNKNDREWTESSECDQKKIKEWEEVATTRKRAWQEEEKKNKELSRRNEEIEKELQEKRTLLKDKSKEVDTCAARNMKLEKTIDKLKKNIASKDKEITTLKAMLKNQSKVVLTKSQGKPSSQDK